jgi:hypothetical protein
MRNPLSLAALADWLDAKPPAETYDYLDNDRCLICQYLEHLGLPYWYVGEREWWDRDGNSHPLPEGFRAVSSGEQESGAIGPWTFGAAARRARELAQCLSTA